MEEQILKIFEKYTDYSSEAERHLIWDGCFKSIAKDIQVLINQYINGAESKIPLNTPKNERNPSGIRESKTTIDKDWIFEIMNKTNAFAKQLIEDHFNRHKIEIYSRPECPFKYCDDPEECKEMNKCHHTVESGTDDTK